MILSESEFLEIAIETYLFRFSQRWSEIVRYSQGCFKGLGLFRLDRIRFKYIDLDSDR